MEKLVMNHKEYMKIQAKNARDERIITCCGVVFILVLTASTIYSFESRNTRMLQVAETAAAKEVLQAEVAGS